LKNIIGTGHVKRKRNDKLLDWFSTEGALTKEDNVIFAERIFMANSAVNWIKTSTVKGELGSRETEAYMKIVKLYLQKKIDIGWQDGTINVYIKKLNGEEDEDSFFETLNGE